MRLQGNSRFRYLNLNPQGKRTGDCVIRATAGAYGISWEEASDLLYSHARAIGCEMSCLGCYSTLFPQLGAQELPADGLTVEEVAERYPQSVLLIRIDGHLTHARGGIIYDIWDCSRERVDRAWKV